MDGNALQKDGYSRTIAFPHVGHCRETSLFYRPLDIEVFVYLIDVQALHPGETRYRAGFVL